MHNPITALYREHEVIIQAINKGKQLEGLWHSDAPEFLNKMKELITFFREYADGYHHRKEEEVLFPAIHDHPEFVLQDILEEFQQHHEDFREYGNEIEEALNDGDYDRGFKIYLRYCSELEDHIGAENDELFVLAENLMSPDQLEKIYFHFQDVDRSNGEERKLELEGAL